MEQINMRLDTIINGQTEIHKELASMQQEMRDFKHHVNQELRDVKQNVVDLTEKVDQLLVRIDNLEKPPLQNTQNPPCLPMSSSSQTSILDLPPEMVEMIIQKITSPQDVGNFSIALVGTRHEKFVMENFLKPQLKIFTSLDLNLKESLKNEGWFEECKDTKLIVRLWKEFKPSLPGIKTFDLDFRHFEYI